MSGVGSPLIVLLQRIPRPRQVHSGPCDGVRDLLSDLCRPRADSAMMRSVLAASVAFM
jgi:hypothetical protein